MAARLRGVLNITARNVAYSGPLNSGCGAEHVQKTKCVLFGLVAGGHVVLFVLPVCFFAAFWQIDGGREGGREGGEAHHSAFYLVLNVFTCVILHLTLRRTVVY